MVAGTVAHERAERQPEPRGPAGGLCQHDIESRSALKDEPDRTLREMLAARSMAIV